MQCPACRTRCLQPAILDDGLLGHGCPHCAGTLVSLLYYRDWAERQPAADASAELAAETEVGETSHALSCPKCAKLMSKFQIHGTRANRFDLCASRPACRSGANASAALPARKPSPAPTRFGSASRVTRRAASCCSRSIMIEGATPARYEPSPGSFRHSTPGSAAATPRESAGAAWPGAGDAGRRECSVAVLGWAQGDHWHRPRPW